MAFPTIRLYPEAMRVLPVPDIKQESQSQSQAGISYGSPKTPMLSYSQVFVATPTLCLVFGVALLRPHFRPWQMSTMVGLK